MIKGKLDLDNLGMKSEVEKPLYKGRYGDFTWQQERVLFFGKTVQFKIYMIIQFISTIYLCFSFARMVAAPTEVVTTTNYLQSVVGMIVSLFVSWAVYKFYKGSKDNDIQSMRTGVSIFKGVYKLAYILGIIALIFAGIAILFSFLSMLMYIALLGVRILLLLVLVVLIIGFGIVNVVFMKKVVNFTEGIKLNIEAKETDFGFHTPQTSILVPFVILSIILWVLGIIGVVSLQSSALVNEYVELGLEFAILYGVLTWNIVFSLFTLYLFKVFDNSMKLSKK